MIDEETFTESVNFHGVKGLLFLDKKIVVFRRDDKTKNYPLQVDLPGGGREKDESPFETFKREVMEEFGISIIKEDIIYSKRYTSVLDQTKVAFFMVTKPLPITESDIVFGDEGLEYMLMTPEEFVSLTDAVDRQQERVREYLEFLQKER
jgi:8-oxo-dGTP diphosphatase